MMRHPIRRFLLIPLILFLSACSSVTEKPATTVSTTGPANAGQMQATQVASGASSGSVSAEKDYKDHEDAKDYIWDTSSVTQLSLLKDSISVAGDGVSVDGSTATITSAGTFNLSGSLADGQIIVDTNDEDVVRLILNGVDLSNSKSAPIFVKDCEKTVIILAENTTNTVTDAEAYVFKAPEEDEPNAAIFSKSDLTISGSGSLTVNGRFNDGIASKDGLIIAGGTITVSAVDDGIRGKDYLVIKDGNLSVTANGDGLKADNEEDATRGYIKIGSGEVSVTSGGDAVTAQTDVLVMDGKFTLTTGEGSRTRLNEAVSQKGVKGAVFVRIDGGTFLINSADDSIHSNGTVEINGGEFVISTGDDGMHADASLKINGGKITINGSYEGLESALITINSGDIRIESSDDGINVAGGLDSSGLNPGGMPGGGGGFPAGGGGRPGGGGKPGGRQDAFTNSGNKFLYLNGGNIFVNADGDGLDINGSVEMKGGVLIVNGPTQRMNGALDYNVSFSISGGFLVAAGSSGMAQAPGESSSQNCILVNFNSTQPAGTLVLVQDSAGKAVLAFSPEKEFQSIAFSSPELKQGSMYDIYVGGSPAGTGSDGLYPDGAKNPGTLVANFTVSGSVTRIGSGRTRP